MNLFNLVNITLDRNEIFFYTMIFMFLVIIINRYAYSLFTYRNIVTVAIAILLIYLITEKNINTKFKQYKFFKKKLSKLEIEKYPYIINYKDTFDILINLQELKKIHESGYYQALYNLNSFFYIYEKIMSDNYLESQLYETLKYKRKRTLNAISSCIFNFKQEYGIYRDTKNNIEIMNINENVLLKNIKLLKEVTRKYMLKAENKINDNWINRTTYNYSSPVMLDAPDGILLHQSSVRDNYAIY